MDIKKIGKTVLFPSTAIMILLLPVATAFLVYSLVFLKSDSPASIISYVISFYTLVIWSVRAPQLIDKFKQFKGKNKFLFSWHNDTRFRVKISLFCGFSINFVYAVFHLCLGLWHHTFWYYSLCAYYICLAIMRFFLARHTVKHIAGEKMKSELIRYLICGIVFLIMNIAFSVIVFFMVYWGRTFRHHEITTIAMAAYTFTAFTVAIINIVRYRKYGSPVYTASKVISLASASVSMLTLEATMLTTFNDGSLNLVTRKLFLALSGGAVSVFIIVMAIYMIVSANKKLKQIKFEKENL